MFDPQPLLTSREDGLQLAPRCSACQRGRCPDPATLERRVGFVFFWVPSVHVARPTRRSQGTISHHAPIWGCSTCEDDLHIYVCKIKRMFTLYEIYGAVLGGGVQTCRKPLCNPWPACAFGKTLLSKQLYLGESTGSAGVTCGCSCCRIPAPFW